jgi:amino acid adenylation domain-containing protein/non-ribosomal peptide synthase protein (TIGR01720 family)
MITQIDRLYDLIFKEFKFRIQDDKLKVYPPDQISIQDQALAKDFINENKFFIITILKNNPDLLPILHINLADVTFPLSFAQERLWFIEKYEQGTNAYHIPMVFKLSNEVKWPILECSIRSIVSRHEILRTIIRENEAGHGYQGVIDNHDHPLEIKHVTLNNEIQLCDSLQKEINCIYDLDKDYPIRVSLYQVKDEKTYYLSVIIHHIAFDGWSIDLFLKELQQFYHYHLNESLGKTGYLNLPELSIQYKDFALWQRSYLVGERLEKQLAYWREVLSGYEPLQLMTDKPRPARVDYQGQDINFELDESTSISLRQLAKALNVSLYTVLLSGYYLLLRSYSQQDDIVLGTPVANRHYHQIEHLIGFFVNSLALRTKIDAKMLLRDFILQVGSDVKSAQLHQDLPFERLVEELKIEKDTSRHPLFQIMFGMQNFGGDLDSSLFIPYTPAQNVYQIAKFDISTFLDDRGSCLKGVFNYATCLYEAETIQNLIKTYQLILRQLSQLAEDMQRQASMTISDLTYLSREDYDKIIYQWNQTDRSYPTEKTLQAMFEDQVRKTPNQIAVIFEDQQITYRELNEKANQLAHYLLAQCDIKPDTLIGLCLARSEQLLIAILAVLKSGGAYVPMDPNYPEERIEYLLQDTETACLLTNIVYYDRLTKIIDRRQSHIVCIPLDQEALQARLILQAKENPLTETTSAHLAYVMYTSGTTGYPKGVMIEHGSVVSLVTHVDYITIGLNDVFILLADIVFDASTFEIWGPLLNGARLVIANDHMNLVADVELFHETLRKYQISILWLTKSLFDQLYLLNTSLFKTIKYLLIGGEALSRELILKILNSNDAPQYLINGYGPTENTVFSCTLNIHKNDIENRSSVPIGAPLSGRKAYVVDSKLVPLPNGAIGELLVGGTGLARGYLNKQALTVDKFIKNPFQTKAEKKLGVNERLYRTGDLVRRLASGNLEYMGRNDFQIKMRGYRIELEEVENALLSYKGISQCTVMLKNHANMSYLIGFYVSDSDLAEEKILTYLETKLPNYMVPQKLIYLDKLPLTKNGKLDRTQLLNIEISSNNFHKSPRNKLEKNLVKIWAEVLNIPEKDVGLLDSFFKLGGDSIGSIQLVSRIRQQLGISISVKDIFKYKNIERLYDNVIVGIMANNKELFVKTEQGILTGEFPLLPIQKWFFAQNFSKKNYWNQSFIIKTESLEIEKLRECVNKLIQHHDCFRVRFKKITDSCYHPYYDPDQEIETLSILDLKTLSFENSGDSEIALQKQLSYWQNNFDLEKGPLYKIGYIFGYLDGSARIFFALHHLIVDTISWRVLVNDLKNLYQENELGLKGSSYRQWVHAVKEYASKHENEKLYWEGIKSDCAKESCNQLKASHSPLNFSSVELSEQQTQQLQNSNQSYHTKLNELLLTAFAYTLHAITQTRMNCIVLEGHGREEIDSSIDVSRTIGWFTTFYPVRLEIGENISDSIKMIKESIRKIPNNGLGYGSFFDYQSELPKIFFNYLGKFNKEDDGWNILDEKSGISIHPNNHDDICLSANGLMIGGRLKFIFKTKLSEEITHKIATVFEQTLQAIIHHTEKQARTYMTPSDIDYIISQRYLDSLQESKEIEAVYLANSLQEGFIYHALNQGQIDDAYRIQLVWQYQNQIDVDKLRQAWVNAQTKFASLRLRFAWQEELVQIIDRKNDLNWLFIDVSNENEVNQKCKIAQITASDRQNRYKLEQGNLFRVTIVKQNESLYTCILNHHHIISDGWSNRILLRCVHHSYLNLIEGKSVAEARDYAYQATQEFLQNHQDSNLEYWKRYLARMEGQNNLEGLLHEDIQEFKLSHYRHIKHIKENKLIIDGELYQSLKKMCSNFDVTLSAVTQYVWHKILNIYSYGQFTITGTTVSGRNLAIDDIENSVGLFINTLPLIVDHQVNNKIIDIIKEIQNDINELNIRSQVNLANLQSAGERLFNNLFVFENYPNENITFDNKIKINFISAEENSDYPINVIVYENDLQLIFKIKYADELFSENKIGQVLFLFKHLLNQIVNNPDQQARDLVFLDDRGYHQILENWSQSIQLYPITETITELFENQVAKTPDNIALKCENAQFTFKETNALANQLARYLQQIYKIKPGSHIALCCDRNENLLIAMLSILKLGAAYVPLDPSYLNDRVQLIVNDALPVLILTNEHYVEKLTNLCGSSFKKYQDKIVAIDNQSLQSHLTKLPSTNLINKISNHEIAYIIYTSGTSGNPKGVVIEHRSVVNYIYNVKNHMGLLPKNKVDFSTNIGFDLSVTTTICALCLGCQVVVYPHSLQDIFAYQQHLLNNDIEIIKLVPSYFELIMDIIPNTKINKIILGGEKLTQSIINKLNPLLRTHKIKIYDEYGPTEATVGTCIYEVNADENLTIGKPYTNYKVYILDDQLKALPQGALGELYIGGLGLARGYLNQSELTAKRFIDNPFQVEEEKKRHINNRLYKTGDLARWLEDGRIKYIGRNDFQVKINGYRIELSEIESILKKHGDVFQSAVIAYEDSLSHEKMLIAYVVPGEFQPSNSELQEFLLEKLPSFMIPSQFIFLDKLPLTINGKLDRSALPKPEFRLSNDYAMPRNPLEEKLCQLWAEVLKLTEKKVGIEDDFFGLGGSSILTIKLVNKINQELGIQINVSDVINHNTVAKLSHYLEQLNDNNAIITKSSITNVEEQSLSFAQERLWFIEKYEEGINAYNMPLLFKLSSTIDLVLLRKTIESIVYRHEILRTLIKENDEGHAYQIVIDDMTRLPMIRHNVSSLDHLEQIMSNEINHIFDLGAEYPIKVCIYEYALKGTVSYYLSIIIHHIAFDGWSTDLFIKELQEFYHYYLNDSLGKTHRLNLPELSIQYKDFAIWQRSYLTGERLEKQLMYWKNLLSSLDALQLMTDKPRPARIDYQGNDIFFELDNATSTSLRELAKILKVSLYTVLLSGYYLLLRSYSQQDDIIVGTPIANRHYHQIEHLIGFFVNSLALRTQIDAKMLLCDFILQVGLEVKSAQLHQDLPFERLVEALKIEKDISRHPLFQIMFGVQTFGGDLDSSLFMPYTPGQNLYQIAKFDISTVLDDRGNCLKGVFNYATSLYETETIQNFIKTYKLILRKLSQLAKDLQQQQSMKIADLSYLSREDYDKIIYQWNQTDRLYPKEKTLHAMFEDQVRKTPDRVAVIFEDKQMTYRELNDKANQLAHYLQAQGLTSNNVVAVGVERSIELIITLLSILKAGCSYVPCDLKLPMDRILFILKDTSSKFLITQKSIEKSSVLLNNFSKTNDNRINIIDWENLLEVLDKYSRENIVDDLYLQNVAYVIYTSGSTGQPKGVLGTHHGMINRLIWSWQTFPFTSDDVCCQKTSINFVDHIAEIFSPLLQGIPLVLLSTHAVNELELKAMLNEISKYRITRIVLIPSLLRVILQQGTSEYVKLDTLKYVFCSGEALSYQLKEDFFKALPWVNLVNLYGSSEMSADISYYSMFAKNDSNEERATKALVSIGKPIDNTKIYILDQNLKPVPLGARGEIYVAGENIAMGYLNQASLTLERFVKNPFQTNTTQTANAILYKTGDLGRWLTDGNIDYLGRDDFQIKLRGYRIEAHEIENVLSLYKGIKQSIVMVKEHYLLGYYEADNTLDEQKILTYLQKKLPEYMIPLQLIHLIKFPLTVSGKIDRGALPQIKLGNSILYQSPRNELENQLCQIWADLLNLPHEKIGIGDDFFQLGGNSLLAIRLASKINQLYQSHLKVADIFIYKTILLLVPRIFQTKASYQAIIKLNNSSSKTNLFMIHPGMAGCEVYANLAATLNNFNCYGVDSYNLYHEHKIYNLHELARYYLSHIDIIMMNTKQKRYHLLGWSLGGQIALEIAGLLEQRGERYINVYLIDTLLNDDYLRELRRSIDINKLKAEYKDSLSFQNYDSTYIDKSIANMDVEYELILQSTFLKLKNTFALLFKAMLKDERFKTENFEKISNYSLTLKYNNVCLAFNENFQIKLICVANAHHGNILQQEELLALNISNFAAVNHTDEKYMIEEVAL